MRRLAKPVCACDGRLACVAARRRVDVQRVADHEHDGLWIWRGGTHRGEGLLLMVYATGRTQAAQRDRDDDDDDDGPHPGMVMMLLSAFWVAVLYI